MCKFGFRSAHAKQSRGLGECRPRCGNAENLPSDDIENHRASAG
jgi:hypothetical protein